MTGDSAPPLNLFLFDMMNPYFLRFFDMDEKPVIIRMILALGSVQPIGKVIERDAERPPRRAKDEAKKTRKRSPAYTAHDIWCAKACRETFAVIRDDEETSSYEKSPRSFLMRISLERVRWMPKPHDDK